MLAADVRAVFIDAMFVFEFGVEKLEVSGHVGLPCIAFQLLDFAPVLLREGAGSSDGACDGEADAGAWTGKSCVFRADAELGDRLRRTPLAILLLDVARGERKLVGFHCLSLTGFGLDAPSDARLVTQCGRSEGDVPFVNALGDVVGNAQVTAALCCLGESMLPHLTLEPAAPRAEPREREPREPELDAAALREARAPVPAAALPADVPDDAGGEDTEKSEEALQTPSENAEPVATQAPDVPPGLATAQAPPPLLPDADGPSFCPPPLFYQAQRVPTTRRARRVVAEESVLRVGARRAGSGVPLLQPAAVVPAAPPARPEGNAEIRTLLGELTRELDFLRSDEFASHILCHGAAAARPPAMSSKPAKTPGHGAAAAAPTASSPPRSGGSQPLRLRRPPQQHTSPSRSTPKCAEPTTRRAHARQAATVHLASASAPRVHASATAPTAAARSKKTELTFRTNKPESRGAGAEAPGADASRRPPGSALASSQSIASHNHRYGGRS